MLEQKIEAWYKKIGKNLLVFGVICILAYTIIRFKVFSLMAPFIIAWLFASLLNPVVTWLNRKLQIPRAIGAIFSMLTILSGILWIIIIVIKQLWYQIITFSATFPEYSKKLTEGIKLLEDKIGSFSNLDNVVEQMLSGISTFLTARIPNVYHAIIKVPNMLIFIIVMLIATFFMTKDYYEIKAFIKAQLSDTISERLAVMQKGMLGALGGYIRTQVILMSITFSICLTGLLVFRISYALLISCIIALIDALPVFGSGSILIPWAVYHIIVGDYMIAVGLLGIYGIIFVMRQIMEPKILSHQIGLYALVTVMAMYIGYKVMGVFGLVLGPVIMVIVKTLQNVGLLPKFKPINDKERKENHR
ncbi:sporulation integral membrane protein YtvI [Cellulosilyticum sp. I15G10I2]|uniref:sporulation integral membrane protein YtvI n=1 Tax=Cellulosilyticum sp. I15G10I2 TaxID=1892843 RepID=UPI00085C0FB5|nr:sporulation integral membrane protein YtvI [Cellulosilyticum sp. I15G10I2]